MTCTPSIRRSASTASAWTNWPTLWSDGSVEGILKPDPRIYPLTASRLGVRCQDVVFLDDQPVNHAGAADVGMTAVPVDVTNPGVSFGCARGLLGL